MFKFSLVLATAVCALFPNVAAAAPTRDYSAKLMVTGEVCIRPTSTRAVERFGIRLGQVRCASPADWSAAGLRLTLDGQRLG